nr:hypothetical protein [uncultured Bacillus sp.]
MGSSLKDRSRVLEKAVWLLVMISIIIGTCYMFMIDKSSKVLMGFFTLALLVLMALGQKYIRLPALFITILYGFIFMAVGLGTFGGMYRVSHFDDVLHVFSGILLGYGSWIILKYMTGKELPGLLPNSFIVLYIFCFSLASAGGWELLEFAGDKLFHFTAQGRDPDDTMYDMIDGMIGGLVAAYFIVKHRVGNKRSSSL